VFESYSSSGERLLWYVQNEAFGKDGHSKKLTPDQVAKFNEYGTFSDKKIETIQRERFEKKNNFYAAVNDVGDSSLQSAYFNRNWNTLREYLAKYNKQRGEDKSLSWWKTFVPIAFYQQKPGSNAQRSILAAVVDGTHTFDASNRSSYGIVKPPTASYVWTTQSGVGGIGNQDASGTITNPVGRTAENDPSPYQGETVNKLARLQKPIQNIGSFTFPPDLDTHYITFTSFSRGRTKRGSVRQPRETGSISLPIPNNLSTGYGAQYSEVGLQVLGNAAQDFVRGGGTVRSAVDQFKIGEAGELLGAQAAAIGASIAPEVGALLGGAMGGVLGLPVGAALAGGVRGAMSGAGLAVNPHMAVLFEGVNFRTHTFNYKFSPRSSSESLTLDEIIFTFKFAMHPGKDGLAFFNYPDEFEIEFSHPDYLFNIGNSVLTSFNVSYQPDGGSHYHHNGAPVSIGLQLAFTEIDINTKEEIGALGR
jgi:hypothetical protein